MVRRCLAYAVIAVSSIATVPSALADTRAVIELFTRQGCSSCPPADKLLGEFAADPSLIAITLPIDIWDYLGWRDTLADPRNTTRWQGYSKARGDRERYTPQAVVNGVAHAVGSDRAAIDKAIAKSRQNAAVMSVPVTLEMRASGRIAVNVPERSDMRRRDRDPRPCQERSPLRSRAARTRAARSPITTWCAAGSSRRPGAAPPNPSLLRSTRASATASTALRCCCRGGSRRKPGALLGAAIASLHADSNRLNAAQEKRAGDCTCRP